MNFPKSMIPRTASIENPVVLALCEKLGANSEPIYLTVQQIAGMEVGECMKNVEQFIAVNGGSVQYGWQIWESPRMVEAEFHAVWVSQEGKFHDITPKELFNVDKILFLPDPIIKYIGRQIDNVRVPVNDNDELIKEFIRVNEQYFEVTNRGHLADQYGEIAATPEMLEIMMERDRISLQLFSEDSIVQKPRVSAKVGRNDPCPCGNGKKYKKCHGA